MGTRQHPPSHVAKSARPLRIGLTGGIGSGKSTVAELFAQLGVPVIDADEVSRAIVAQGLPAYSEIVTAYGRDVLSADGSIDRAALRARIFASPEERKRLEAILHPRIRQEMALRLSSITAPYCLMVVPLLVETGQYIDVDRVLVVDASPDNQIERVRARSKLESEEVRRIMATQARREERLAHAHDVIENDSDLSHLKREVARLHNRYLTLAGARA